MILVQQKPVEGREEAVEDGTTLGREGCDVNLPDPEVSRRHAAIRAAAGGSFAIEDLGSSNGTFVNGERVRGVTALRDGDSVRLGNTLWSVRSAAAAAAAAPGGTDPATRRGDVEPPPEVAPSAIRRVLPPPAPGQASAFAPPSARPRGGSAATRVEATIVCTIIVALVAVALVVYFVTY